VAREKYSELKLEANFLRVSPGYLTAVPGSRINTSNKAVVALPIIGKHGSFYVVQHADYQLTSSTSYNLTLPTSVGTLNIPQLGGSLTLSRRDSKIHVTDYPVGDTTLIYCTPEILTWQRFQNRTVLVVYGGVGELHEIAINTTEVTTITGERVIVKTVDNSLPVVQWQASATKRWIVKAGSLQIYLIGRFPWEDKFVLCFVTAC
jgi:Beta-galactosidase, domain 2